MTRFNNLLSISIPVYNFESYLYDCLDSLLEESFKFGVEVVVFDGCSTDKTQLVVEAYQIKYPNLRYVKAREKGGIDVDMAKSVDFASGKYCWLFSGDDIAHSGSISTILSIISQYSPDLILCRHNECDHDLNILKDWKILDLNKDRMFSLDIKEERLNYLSLALNSEAYFSFMGGLVINRRTWFKEKLNPKLDGSCWAHVGRLWLLTNDTFKLYYVHKTLLDRRGGNDSFSEKGSLSRLKIQINGLIEAVGTVFENSSGEIQNLKRVIKNEVLPDWVNAVKADLIQLKAPEKDFHELENIIKRIK